MKYNSSINEKNNNKINNDVNHIDVAYGNDSYGFNGRCDNRDNIDRGNNDWGEN